MLGRLGLVFAVVAAAGASLTLSPAVFRSPAATTTKCLLPFVRFDGTDYRIIHLGKSTLARGRAAGQGSHVTCEVVDGNPKYSSTPIRLYRLRGVKTRVALARVRGVRTIFVSHGACRGRNTTRAMVACIRSR